ncbi:zinc finger protein GLIS2b [Erpetoichthys calabaricus]|uniref:Zinc finger protein GLIS2 n=1 Tax=Erpetoichthys calabaricus TaxID=27687 RepID=A0A8C4T0T0_ERPCA|nr:zinc finger protein GLIS2b [Erpetoichthys calabaricus]
MLSLDEPLDLKLTLSKVKETRERTIREPSTGNDITRSCRLKRTEDDVAVTIPSLSATSDAGFPLLPGPLSQSKADSRHQSSAVMELRLSPTSNLEMSPGPALSPSELPDGDGSSSSFSMDSHPARFIEGGTSSQAFQFFLPVGSGAGLQLPSSMFIGSPKEKRISPELCIDEQLACRWVKCNLLFDSLQDLVDHVNDFHVKPEKDSGYCCHWEGCARRGRGFNARYKMLIHIRTHTNEKPHRCPVCNKSFSRLENLKIHNRSHTGEKPYICPYEGCNKRYSNSSDRFKHTRTHYIDKPYYCKMAGCLKRYTDPSSLRKHIKAHGHFVSHDQQASLLKGNRHLNKGAADIPYMSGAHIVIPGTAAPLFRSHALQGLGTALPLPLSSAHPLDLSALACAGLGSPSLSTLSSPILSLIGTPIGLTKTSMLSPSFSSGGLGLPMVSVLAGSSDKLGLAKDLSVKSLSHSKQAGPKSFGRLRSDSDGLADAQGAVLNLSTGPGSLGRPDSLAQGWVVIPPGTVVLKPAVVT